MGVGQEPIIRLIWSLLKLNIETKSIGLETYQLFFRLIKLIFVGTASEKTYLETHVWSFRRLASLVMKSSSGIFVLSIKPGYLPRDSGVYEKIIGTIFWILLSRFYGNILNGILQNKESIPQVTSQIHFRQIKIRKTPILMISWRDEWAIMIRPNMPILRFRRDFPPAQHEPAI